MADGSIRISTAIDNRQARKELAELEKMLAKAEKEQEKLYTSKENSAYKEETENARQLYEMDLKSNQQWRSKAQMQEEYRQKLEAIDNKYSDLLSKSEQYQDKIAEIKNNMSTVKERITDTADEQRRETKETEKTEKSTQRFRKGLEKARKTIRNIGTAIGAKIAGKLKSSAAYVDKMRKSFLKVGLALVGIRGLMGGLRQIVREALSQNETLSNQVTTIKGVLAQALAPAIQIVANALGQVISFVDTLYARLTGVSLIAKYNASQAEKLAKNTAEAAEEAKKYQKQLAGFDKINKLNDDEENKSKTTANNVPTFEKSALSNWADDLIAKIKEAWKNKDFTDVGKSIAEKITKGLRSINWDEVQKNAFGGGKSFATFLNGLFSYTDKDGESLTEAIGETVAQAFNTLTATIKGFVTNFEWGNFGTQLGKGLNKMFNTIKWDEAGKTLSATLLGLFDTAINFMESADWGMYVQKIETFLSNIQWGELFKKSFHLTGDIVGAVASIIGQMIVDAGRGAKEYFKPYIEEMGGDILGGILFGMIDVIANIGDWIAKNIFVPLIEGFKNTFQIHSPSKNKEIINLGKNIIEGVFNGVVEWMKNIGTWLQKNVLDKLIAGWKSLKTDVFEIKAKFSQSANDIKNAWQSRVKNVKDKTANINAKFKQSASQISKMWKERTDKVKNKTFELTAKFKDAVTGTINLFISKINALLTKLRNLKIGVLQPFADIKNIPKLAQGGIVPAVQGGTIAMLGEGKANEAVLPLTDEVLGKLASMINSFNNGQIVLQNIMDGEIISQKVIKINEQRNFRLNKGGAF